MSKASITAAPKCGLSILLPGQAWSITNGQMPGCFRLPLPKKENLLSLGLLILHLLQRRKKLELKRPPKKQNKRGNNPNLQPLLECDLLLLLRPITLKPGLLALPLRSNDPIRNGVISHDGIDLMPNTPPHEIRRVNGPDVDHSVRLLGFLQEAPSQGSHEDALVDVKADVGRCIGEELSGVADVEAD